MSDVVSTERRGWLWWWPARTRGDWIWLLSTFAIGTLGLGAFLAYRRRALQAAAKGKGPKRPSEPLIWPTPEEVREYEQILFSDDRALQSEGLKTIYQQTTSRLTHDNVRENGLLDVLIRFLATFPEPLLMLTTSALTNLSVNEENCRAMAQGNAISLLLDLLNDARSSAKLRENVLRAMTNLATVRENEDRIREAGALPHLLALFEEGQEREVPQEVLFQASRVLVNLIDNEKNYTVILENNGLEHTIRYLHSTEDIEFLRRLVRLLGCFALPADAPTYNRIATAENAERLAAIFQKHQAEGDDRIDHILLAIAKIVGEQHANDKAKQDKLREFQTAFTSDERGLAAIFSFLTDENAQRRNCAKAVLHDLVRNNAEALESLREVANAAVANNISAAQQEALARCLAVAEEELRKANKSTEAGQAQKSGEEEEEQKNEDQDADVGREDDGEEKAEQ
ncbi:hypothetical protein QOT17_002795 [Balamuthia mandrillaris]